MFYFQIGKINKLKQAQDRQKQEKGGSARAGREPCPETRFFLRPPLVAEKTAFPSNQKKTGTSGVHQFLEQAGKEPVFICA
jgi:hypothetical protein